MIKEITLSIEEVLNNYGSITYKVTGKSMQPMIFPGKDIVTVIKKKHSTKLQENDVVLYRQKGKLILHRVVKVLPNDEYVILGDNCSRKEYGVSDKDIIGILTSFKHNGIHYDVTDKIYLQYINRLRKSEYCRTKRKLIYDIIIRHLDFLPRTSFLRIKSILKKIIVHQIDFV